MMRAAIFSLFATACVGSLTGGDVDPPEPEPPQQPMPEPVTDVTVRVGTANAKIVFQAPDDTVIADVITDASGTATAKMPSGGTLSVIRSYDDYGDHVFTFLGVEPGDNLELALGRDLTPITVQISVNLDPGTPVAVRTPCGSAQGVAPTIAVTLRGCASETDFMVADLGEGEPTYFAVHAPIATEIDFTGETFRGVLATELRASNMTMQTVQLQKRLLLGNFQVYDTGALPAPIATAAVPELPNTQQILSAYVSDGERTFVISSRQAYAATPATIDIASRTVPSSTAPMFAGNTLWWTEVGSGFADVSVAHLYVAERKLTRHIAGVHTGTSMRVPPLPAQHDAYNFTPLDAPKIYHNLATLDGGYDAVRARVFDHGLADIAPMGGSAASSMYASN